MGIGKIIASLPPTQSRSTTQDSGQLNCTPRTQAPKGYPLLAEGP